MSTIAQRMLNDIFEIYIFMNSGMRKEYKTTLPSLSMTTQTELNALGFVIVFLLWVPSCKGSCQNSVEFLLHGLFHTFHMFDIIQYMPISKLWDSKRRWNLSEQHSLETWAGVEGSFRYLALWSHYDLGISWIIWLLQQVSLALLWQVCDFLTCFLLVHCDRSLWLFLTAPCISLLLFYAEIYKLKYT